MAYTYNTNGWQKDAESFLRIYQLAQNKGKEYYTMGSLFITGDTWDTMDCIYKLEELEIIKCIDKSGKTQDNLFITVKQV